MDLTLVMADSLVMIREQEDNTLLLTSTDQFTGAVGKTIVSILEASAVIALAIGFGETEHPGKHAVGYLYTIAEPVMERLEFGSKPLETDQPIRKRQIRFIP